METLQPVVKPLQDMMNSTKLIPNVDVKDEKHIQAELEDNSSIDGNYDKKSEKNDNAMSIEDPDSIAQAIRERSFRYQPYLRDQKKRKLVDTSFLKSPRGNWVNEERLRDKVSSEKELNYNFNDGAHKDDDDYVENESIRVTVHDPPTSDSEGDKKNIMMKARLLIQTIMNVAFFKSGYKNPLDLPIEKAMTQRAAMEFVSDHNQQESGLIGKIGQTIHLSMSSMESYFTSKFREVEVYTVKISEDMFRREANTERLETDELNENLGNFPEHILGNEGGEVQDISKDEEVDKKKILLEENVEVDEDEFRKLEERMYNE
ncbi:hypothetical protein QAD02_013942 [Eretmocerus hayati]|uniref:Uncharacterized protein n=1 Tax=Eretmocerus hayati TaxID=131215 RepID=A0ACC2P446_9HYME|nr:hypothetical protein QAD02_013942 [Eretmocerus hayati]